MERTLEQWAASWETTIAVAEIIMGMAGDDEDVANRICDDPTDEEMVSLVEGCERKGLRFDKELWCGHTIEWLVANLAQG